MDDEEDLKKFAKYMEENERTVMFFNFIAISSFFVLFIKFCTKCRDDEWINQSVFYIHPIHINITSLIISFLEYLHWQ